MFQRRFPGFKVFFVLKVLSSISKINCCILPKFLKIKKLKPKKDLKCYSQEISCNSFFKMFNSNVHFILIFY